MFENEYEFVKSYIDDKGVNECTVSEIIRDNNLLGFDWDKVIKASIKYLGSLNLSDDVKEDFLDYLVFNSIHNLYINTYENEIIPTL